MRRKAEVRDAIGEAFERHRDRLAKEITDEMALPSYLHGNALSRFVFWRKLDVILRTARLRPGMRVLDFGCGSGVLLPSLARDDREIIGTDRVLDVAREVVAELGLRGVELLPADAWETRIADGSLDVIIAANVFEHIADRRAVFARMIAKLGAEGRTVISGPSENALYRLGRRLVGFTGHYHVSNIDDVYADAEAAGLRMIARRHWPLPGAACLYQIAAFSRCG